MKPIIKIISLCALALMASGCGVYTRYSRPDVTTEGLFGEDIATTDTTTIANMEWRALFTDPYLQYLLERALANNTDLQIAWLRTQKSHATLQAAGLAYLPSLSLNPQGAVSSWDGNKATKTYTLPADASWEVDIFGRLTASKQQARAAFEQSEAYRQAVQTQLIANVTNTYYTLLMLDSQLGISRRTLQTWQENVQVLRALKAAGQSNEASVAQAKANCLSVEASVLDLSRQIREVENALCTTLGETPHTVERGNFSRPSLPADWSVGVSLQLLSNRPDVRQAEAGLKQAFYAANAARAAFYPSITLGGSAGWTNNGGAITNSGAWLLQAVGSLTQPLFNKGKNTANLKIAKAQQEEATLTFQQSLLDAGAEVNNALTQYQVACEKTDIYEEQITLLETAVRSTRLLMQYGSTTYLEVLTAQQTLLQAELTQVANQFDEIQAVVNLYQALGGGR